LVNLYTATTKATPTSTVVILRVKGATGKKRYTREINQYTKGGFAKSRLPLILGLIAHSRLENAYYPSSISNSSVKNILVSQIRHTLIKKQKNKIT